MTNQIDSIATEPTGDCLAIGVGADSTVDSVATKFSVGLRLMSDSSSVSRLGSHLEAADAAVRQSTVDGVCNFLMNCFLMDFHDCVFVWRNLNTPSLFPMPASIPFIGSGIVPSLVPSVAPIVVPILFPFGEAIVQPFVAPFIPPVKSPIVVPSKLPSVVPNGPFLVPVVAPLFGPGFVSSCVESEFPSWTL